MNEAQQAVAVKESKPPILFGERGLQVSSLDELWRFANYVAKSGFAPKGMDSPEALTVAMQLGYELGVTPMAAIQNIAVINGRPSIWGDLALAIVRGTGQMEVFEEWLESGGTRCDRPPAVIDESTVAFCRIKRKGYTPATASFSYADAKRSRLASKPGPWQEYPLRMLQLRARGFALRDQFGDALKGIITREEARDIDPVDRARDVTPRRPTAETPTAPTPEPESLSSVSDADDIPMSYSTPESAAETPQKDDPTKLGVAFQTLQDSVMKEGVKFSQFVRGLKEAGLLDSTLEPDGYGDLPPDLVNKLNNRASMLSAVLKAVKTLRA